MIAGEVKKVLFTQINRFLNNEITKEEYADIAEPYYSKYAEYIEDSKFYRVFSDIIPDACLTYVDEPGLTEEKKKNILEENWKELTW